MVPRIKALCPTCRVVDIDVGDATLEIHGFVREATCRFTCPGCRVTLAKPIPPPLVQLLIRAGVEHTLPAGAVDAPPPLTAADALRFRRELEAYGSGMPAMPQSWTPVS